jgi:hypothetical protein
MEDPQEEPLGLQQTDSEDTTAGPQLAGDLHSKLGLLLFNQFKNNQALNAVGIIIQVKGSQVALHGKVPKDYMIKLAQKIADETSGVSSVTNNLFVGEPYGGTHGSGGNPNMLDGTHGHGDDPNG